MLLPLWPSTLVPRPSTNFLPLPPSPVPLMKTSLTSLVLALLQFTIALSVPAAPPAPPSPTPLARALTLHASFDNSLNADFAVGDKTCYDQSGAQPAAPNDDVTIAPNAGRFGGALHVKRKNTFWPAFKDAGSLNYNDKNWSTTVALWMKLDPDNDLEPGYCDPVQINGDDGAKGFIFLEWSKDERPRYFRFAIQPLRTIWNPAGTPWDEIPFDKRPMVQVERAPFSHDDWTHVVFTIENANDKTKPQRGRLYINGQPQGSIENWELTLGWKPESVMLVLAASYVGHIDDLATFNRALTAEEVTQLYNLKSGAAELRR